MDMKSLLVRKSELSREKIRTVTVLLLLIAVVLFCGCNSAPSVDEVEIKKSILPSNRVISHKVYIGTDRRIIKSAWVNTVSIYFFLYISTLLLGTLFICTAGINIKDALFEFASALGNSGMSSGITSINTPDSVLWIETIGMVVERFEIFTLITGVYFLINKGANAFRKLL